MKYKNLIKNNKLANYLVRHLKYLYLATIIIAICQTSQAITLQKPNKSPRPSYKAIKNAINAYQLAEQNGQILNQHLTIIDFTLPSYKKRMWTINMRNGKIIYNDYTAHGKGSGDKLYATDFSNTPNSFKSSLGLYITGEKYYGKYGIGVRLNGITKGINDNSYKRHITMHQADYTSEEFIKKHGFAGRTRGCIGIPPGPAAHQLSRTIADGSAIFIYHESLEKSLKLTTL